MKSTVFWIGVVSGGIIGAGLGLLLAPSRGEETRAEISRAASSARNRAIAPLRDWEKSREEADVIKQAI